MGYGMPGMPPPGGPPLPLAPAPPVMELPDDEPPSKKLRGEDNLIGEAAFLAAHKGPVTLQVQVPVSNDKPEWRLNGQMVSLTLSLNDTVNTLKQKLQDETNMPPAKQKISYDVSSRTIFFCFPMDIYQNSIFFHRVCSSRIATRLRFTIC